MSNINETLDTMWTDWFQESFDSIFVLDEEDEVPGLVLTPIKIKAFVRAPAFSTEVAEIFAGLAPITDLAGRPEWVESRSTPVFTSNDSTAYLRKREEGATPVSLEAGFIGGIDRAYIEDGIGWTFTGDDVQEVITAVVFYFDGTVAGEDDPILFATTRGCGISTVVHDNSLFGVAQSYTGGTADLLTVANVDDLGKNPSSFAARHVLLDPGLPPWESAHAQHLWIEPQRVNLIANPAFQDASIFGWRSSPETTLERVAGGVDTWRDDKYCLEIGGDIYSKKLESNFFPNVGEWYSGSFSVSVSTPASFRCGIVAFDPTYTKPRYVVSNYSSLGATGSATQGFLRVQFLAKMFPDAADLCFRLEVEGADEVWVSNVLIDPHPGQYDYFDGACTRGAAGDFRWMGGEEEQHFSLWYNNYRNTKSRIVGGYDPDDEVYKPGLVEEWAPTGATILAHWDAVTSITPQTWSGDAYYLLGDVSNSETTVVISEYTLDLTVRRETGYVPYVLDSNSQFLFDETGSVFL